MFVDPLGYRYVFSISTGDRRISSTCQVGGARGASPAREVECSGFQTFGVFFFSPGMMQKTNKHVVIGRCFIIEGLHTCTYLFLDDYLI